MTSAPGVGKESVSIDDLYRTIDRHFDAIARLRVRIATELLQRDESVDARSGIPAALSEMQAKVARYLVNTPMTTEQIARVLFLSVNTIKTHTKAIYRHMGVTTRAELVKKIIEAGQRP